MASASSTKDCRDLYLLKQKAMKYYEENMVPVKMEEVLNSMFYDDPQDVYGHLVNFFSQYTLPAKLCKMSAFEVFDAQGTSTCQTNAFCTVNNKEKLMSSTVIPTPNLRVRPEDREKVELEVHDSVISAIKLINETLSDRLRGLDPTHQKEIDDEVLAVIENLREEDLARKAKEEAEREEATPPPPPVDEKEKKKTDKSKKEIPEKGGKNSAPLNVTPERPLEVFLSGSEAVSAISQAVCACAAAAQNVPIYRHVSHISRKKGPVHEFRLPLPMVTILQSGKMGAGKSNCIKEYMVVPGIDMSIDKSIEHIKNIYNHVAKSFASKMGVSAKYVNETGALCPAMDSPTQGLDLLQEAVNAQGLTIGEDIHLAINVAANDFFDHERGKYEIVSGQLKTSDDMVEFWSDIISKYPSILAIIDPLRGEDREAWMKLCERVSEAVFVMGDYFYERPGLLQRRETHEPVCTSGLVMSLERMNSVSDIIECSNRYKEFNNEVVIAANQSDTNDTFIVDLAVGLNARFFKVGGPCRGERSSKLNRLLQIYHELDPPAREEPVANTDENSPIEAPKKDGCEGEEENPPEDDGEEEEEEEEETEEGEEDEGGDDKQETGQDKSAEQQQEEEELKGMEMEGHEQQEELTWGEGENSRLQLHKPFNFPLIQNPPIPELEGEEGEKEEKSTTPISKRSK